MWAIRTDDLWRLRQPLCQLCLNNSLTFRKFVSQEGFFFLFFLSATYISLMKIAEQKYGHESFMIKSFLDETL